MNISVTTHKEHLDKTLDSLEQSLKVHTGPNRVPLTH
jgi:hypothetical protein